MSYILRYIYNYYIPRTLYTCVEKNKIAKVIITFICAIYMRII